MLARGEQVRGVGCYAQPVIRKVRVTSNGSVDAVCTQTASESDIGFVVTPSSSGTIYTVTGNKAKRATLLFAGQVSSAAATTTATHRLIPTAAPSPTTGAYGTYSAIDNTNTLEAIPNTTVLEFTFIVDEGSS
jgi:hypothetical protein